MGRRVDYSAKAKAFVGTKFRPQGRDRSGLDCLGLMIAAYEIPGDEVRRDYRLRGDHVGEVLAKISQHFRRVQAGLAGDALLLQVAPDQVHFAVLSPRGFIHADAALKRVVETPGAPPWPVLGIFRRRARKHGEKA